MTIFVHDQGRHVLEIRAGLATTLLARAPPRMRAHIAGRRLRAPIDAVGRHASNASSRLARIEEPPLFEIAHVHRRLRIDFRAHLLRDLQARNNKVLSIHLLQTAGPAGLTRCTNGLLLLFARGDRALSHHFWLLHVLGSHHATTPFYWLTASCWSVFFSARNATLSRK